jgi:hypothetical protein
MALGASSGVEAFSEETLFTHLAAVPGPHEN